MASVATLWVGSLVSTKVRGLIVVLLLLSTMSRLCKEVSTL